MTEDYVIQAMPDVSPPKWHLAHTSWFFETFILALASPGYRSPHASYAYLFNSYYVAAGERHCRPKRGLLSRPTIEEVYRYRAYVDQHMTAFLEGLHGETLERWSPIVELGLHHEQQHQELLLTDVKYNFACNPLRPAYVTSDIPTRVPAVGPLRWVSFLEGVYWIGHDGQGFAFDNEFPRHRSFVERFELASRLVTNGEYLAFMADGGYERPELWLSMGWDTVRREGWQAPLYWEQRDGTWWMMTLAGMRPVREAEPVCHVSYYEADAYARWADARLPTEAEWEVAAMPLPIRVISLSTKPSIPSPSARSTPLSRWSKFLETSGSGPKVTIPPIRGTPQHQARWGSITANLWPTSLCCAAGRVRPRSRISGPPIGTFSLPMPDGSSWGSGSPERSGSKLDTPKVGRVPTHNLLVGQLIHYPKPWSG